MLGNLRYTRLRSKALHKNSRPPLHNTVGWCDTSTRIVPNKWLAGRPAGWRILSKGRSACLSCLAMCRANKTMHTHCPTIVSEFLLLLASSNQAFSAAAAAMFVHVPCVMRGPIITQVASPTKLDDLFQYHEQSMARCVRTYPL